MSKPPRPAIVPALLLATGLSFSFVPAARALPSAPGVPITNIDWAILMTDEGYSDLVLDQRAGFKDREYLSGEWAGAICYTGGSNPAGAIWLRKQWAFPCWTSNSNFTVTQVMNVIGTNMDGFDIFESKVANPDVEITMTYQMVDSVSGVEQGAEPATTGSTPTSITSSRYVLKQTYTIKNISGEGLSNVKFYQFLHGLNTGLSIYDDREYSGPMDDFRYDLTQWGTSRSFHKKSGAIWEHDDTISCQANVMPTQIENGYFGIKGIDSHQNGKPATGVHLSVEGASLNDVDTFDPPEGRWVAGAMCFALGSLADQGSTSIDFLLSIKTTSTFMYPRPDLHIFRAAFNNDGDFEIDFEDRNSTPDIGFILRRNSFLMGNFPVDWPQVPVPRFIDVPHPGASRFTVPAPGVESEYYLVEAFLPDC